MLRVFDTNHRDSTISLPAVAIAWLAGWLSMSISAAGADRIVLRNLTIISDKNVTAFDEDGVRLSDGSVKSWDKIDRGTVAPEKQEEFDRMLNELGPQLYRIRQRLEVRDYRDILPYAKAVSSKYVGRYSETAYMVFQALMWSRLARGQKEQALEPYFRCVECMRFLGTTNVPLPGDRRLVVDPKIGMTPEMSPVWFDKKAAKQAMPEVLAVISQMKKPILPAAYIYYATLALSAGEEKAAMRILGRFESESKMLMEIHNIAMVQREVLMGRPGDGIKQLEANLDHLEAVNKPLALYWLGMARISSSDDGERKEGLMTLLRLPALHGEEYPDLAGASLYESMAAMDEGKDLNGKVMLRKELLTNFGQTYHAARLRALLSPDTDGATSSDGGR